MEREFSTRILEKYSNIQFHENSSSGRRDIPCGQTDRRTNMTKIRVVFRNFVNSTKNEKKTIPKEKEEDSISVSVSEGLLSGANVLQTGARPLFIGHS
jgi:hypothetical protein